MKKTDDDQSIDITLIVNIHREYKFIARTFRSLCDAVHHAQSNNLSCEVVLVLDRSDEETKKAVLSWKNLFCCRTIITEVDNGSLALSRMSGLVLAMDQYVSLHDADDLVSYNYITEKHRACKNDDNAIVLPEIMISFGAKEWLTFYCGVDPRILIDTHPYISQIFCRKDVLASVTYEHPKSNSHRAFEDWHINTILISKGHHFINAPKSVLFYRQRADSIMGQVDNSAVIRIIEPSCFFKPAVYLNTLEKHALKQISRNQTENRESISKRLATPAFHLTLDAAAQTEPQVMIQAKSIAGIHSFINSPKHAGLIYEELCKIAGGEHFPWRHIFILPSLCIGGGEKFLIQIAKSTYLNSNERPLFITTDAVEDNSWKGKIEDFCDHFHIAVSARDLDEDPLTKAISLAPVRVSENSPFKVFFLVKTAPAGYKIQNLCAPYVPKRSFVNYRFSDDASHRTMRESLSDFTLKQMEINLGKNIVISDYEGIKHRDEFYFGSKIKDYHPVRAYVEQTNSPVKTKKTKKKRLLWISRYSEHKRVSLLPLIARSFAANHPDLIVDLYTPGIKEHESASITRANQNFIFKGTASGFHEIDTSLYDALIYTSWLDGIPNVLIESMSVGLPAIAPVIGGIPELISDGTNGFLIESCLDDDEMCSRYVNVIKRVYELSDRQLHSICLNAIEFINKNHSLESHRKSVHEIFRNAQ